LRQQRTQLILGQRGQAGQQKSDVLFGGVVRAAGCLQQLRREARLRVAERLERLDTEETAHASAGCSNTNQATDAHLKSKLLGPRRRRLDQLQKRRRIGPKRARKASL
jgi:hypothetical protein